MAESRMAHAAAIVMTMILAVAGMMACATPRPHQAETSFDSSLWKGESDWRRPWTIRRSMLHDLLANHLHMGMELREVEALLGHDNGGTLEDGVIIYCIGRSTETDESSYDWLNIGIGQDRLVTGLDLSKW